MPPGALKKQLIHIGHALRRWQALLWLKSCIAAALLWLWMATLADLLLQMNRPFRLVFWGIFILLCLFSFGWAGHIRARKFSLQGMAAHIEHVFPFLDNRLINFLQFSENPGKDPFKLAYIRAGVPEWNRIDVKRLHNHRAEMHSRLALSLAILFLLVPVIPMGRAWTVALWRTANPFTALAPVSQTRILTVEPGNRTVLAGTSLILSCRVNGRKDHAVWLDIKHADGADATYSLGRLEANHTDQVFFHHISQVKAKLNYRFRAGDSPSPQWFQIDTRPPLALTSVIVEETPPEYLGRQARQWDTLSEKPEFHQNASLRIKIAANAPLESAYVILSEASSNRLYAAENNHSWTGTVASCGSSPMVFSAQSADERILSEIEYNLITDPPPRITIRAPTEPVRLKPNGRPAIDFVVHDDHGLEMVAIERILAGSNLNEPGKRVATWTPQDRQTFETVWQASTNDMASTSRSLSFRVFAQDRRGENEGLTSRSDPVLFTLHTFGQNKGEDAGTQSERDHALLATMEQVIELQRTNIEKTKQALANPATAGQYAWRPVAERQEQLRKLSRTLLELPGKPLGGLSLPLRQLYLNEMLEAIALLGRLPNEPAESLVNTATEALAVQEKILRRLTATDITAKENQVQRSMNDVAALLISIIQTQEGIVKQTASFVHADAKIGSILIDRQDDLASDMAGFIRTVENESAAVAAQDREFSILLRRLAEQATSDKIRENMLQAADFLDRNEPAEALKFERQALADLQTLQEMLESVRTARKEERIEAIRETLGSSAERMKRIREIHESAQESMDALREQGDVSDAEYDLMEEEYKELLQTTRNALLEIPVDLHIFPELNVANEMVEDVFSVFEEIEQQAGSEKFGEEDVEFQPFSKEDLQKFLDDMEEAEGFIADMESWLPDKPDNQQITFEAFDQEEMPESGVAVGDLAAQAQDLISDLLDEAEDMEEEAQDGATNLGMSDMNFGDAVLEGETTTFSAGGKSGNTRPDHKEQDGRSNVGREGMSSGETAAGSGTIQEGDQDIEARRTQDPTQDGQVQADGEAQTAATGGGKLGSGKADEYGMEGTGSRRMDSMEAGSTQGMEALLARKAEKLSLQASLQNIRSHSLDMAAHHLRQAADAVERGRPIGEIRELRKEAAATLRRATTELNAGIGSEIYGHVTPGLLDGTFEGNTENAPASYKSLLAEYYRNLNESL